MDIVKIKFCLIIDRPRFATCYTQEQYCIVSAKKGETLNPAVISWSENGTKR